MKIKWFYNPHTKKNAIFSCIKKEDGYMTLLGCLLFLAVSGLLFACLDGSLVYQARARSSMAETGLSEHLLANYNAALSKQYQLYFLDPQLAKPELEEKAQTYYEELFSGSSGYSLIPASLWNLTAEEISVDVFGTLQEKECRYFVEQITEYMKYDIAKDAIMSVLKSSSEDAKEQEHRMDEAKENVADEPLKEEETESDANTPTDPSYVAQTPLSDDEKGNPVTVIKHIFDSGLLGVVTEGKALSERKLLPSLLPFTNQKGTTSSLSFENIKNAANIKQLLSEQNLSEMPEALSQKGLLSCYIRQFFNYYERAPQISNTQLSYEVEYILAGQYTDRENLESVVNRLILLRFACNGAYLLNDEGWRNQALAMAAVLTGITGTPEFMEAVQYIILAAVDLIESVGDVQKLMQGEKVPLFKTAATWRTSIEGEAANNLSGQKKEGLSYPDYLLLLLMTYTNQEQLCLRMQNLMQVNIQQADPGFQIKNCHAGVTIDTVVGMKTIFYNKTYRFAHKETYRYLTE